MCKWEEMTLSFVQQRMHSLKWRNNLIVKVKQNNLISNWIHFKSQILNHITTYRKVIVGEGQQCIRDSSLVIYSMKSEDCKKHHSYTTISLDFIDIDACWQNISIKNTLFPTGGGHNHKEHFSCTLPNTYKYVFW